MMWAGAKNAGWHSIWFNRRKKTTVVGLEPEYCVTSEEELAELLQNICGA
ncbi:hypothetical protein [Eubacterium ramulus]